MQRTKIEWTDYTWNPVVGCKNNCWYCYGKKMNQRFKWVKNWNEPEIYMSKMVDPINLKKPSKIFVCSIADLFGDWIPGDWITPVLEIVKYCPRHTFQFLTKNPKRYFDFEFPENCWLGITVDYANQDRIDKLKMYGTNKWKNYKFISLEPLLSDMSAMDLKGIDLAIVGAMTGQGAIKPKKEWIDSIKHPNIFYKDNIKKYL